MYEHKSQKLAPASVYYGRIRRNALLALYIVLVFLAIGMAGYKITIPEFSWYDSFVNAAMILSGMGPMIDNNIHLSDASKVFAGIYALLSGIAFLSTFGLLIAPVVHRFFHKLHIQDETRS